MMLNPVYYLNSPKYEGHTAQFIYTYKIKKKTFLVIIKQFLISTISMKGWYDRDLDGHRITAVIM